MKIIHSMSTKFHPDFYGSHTLRKTYGYHQRAAYRMAIPTLMVCYNHATQKQALDYLCIQPEEIKNVFSNEL